MNGGSYAPLGFTVRSRTAHALRLCAPFQTLGSEPVQSGSVPRQPRFRTRSQRNSRKKGNTTDTTSCKGDVTTAESKESIVGSFTLASQHSLIVVSYPGRGRRAGAWAHQRLQDIVVSIYSQDPNNLNRCSLRTCCMCLEEKV